jgi:hypothetical protein
MKKSVILLFLISFACNTTSPLQTQQPMPDQTNKVEHLQPIVITSPGAAMRYGLDLNSVAAQYPELVLKDAHGNPISVNLLAFIPILIQQIQVLQDQVNQNQ